MSTTCITNNLEVNKMLPYSTLSHPKSENVILAAQLT